jgi:hypothetical protein
MWIRLVLGHSIELQRCFEHGRHVCKESLKVTPITMEDLREHTDHCYQGQVFLDQHALVPSVPQA